MTAERKPYITQNTSKFKTNSNNRLELETNLKQLGLRWNNNNEAVVPSEKISFIKNCLREDLGISPHLKLKIRWYETGNAFSTAVDNYGNNIIQIHLGNKDTIFQVGFQKRAQKFTGLYYNKKLVTSELLKNLL